MSRFDFSLATEADEAQISQLINSSSISNRYYKLSFKREPSYFKASVVQGEILEIIKGVDSLSQKLVFLGSGLKRKVFVNGSQLDVGYLCDLKVYQSFRKSVVLKKGYQYFERRHQCYQLPFYLSLILEGNIEALNTIAKDRAGLPVYRDVGRYCTYLLKMDGKFRPIELPGVSFRKAETSDLRIIFDFLNEEGCTKQFSRVYDVSAGFEQEFPGLRPSDFHLAFRGAQLVGVIAAWDQSSVRQTYLDSYSGGLGFIRPVYNVAASIFRQTTLPKPGSKLSFFNLSMISIKNNCPEIFSALLRYLYLDRQKKAWDFCVCGLHERDPLLGALAPYKKWDSSGRLFLVYFPGQEDGVNRIDSRIPYFDVGTI